MNRLTKKEYNRYEVLSNRDFAHGRYYADNYYSKLDEAIDKLGQLEDIEEEFGIDLIEILTAKEVYTFETEVIAPHKLGRTNEIIKCNMFLFDFANKIIHIHVPKVGLYYEPFSDYGKTWSIRKEDLKYV